MIFVNYYSACSVRAPKPRATEVRQTKNTCSLRRVDVLATHTTRTKRRRARKRPAGGDVIITISEARQSSDRLKSLLRAL